ncbi:MAG: redoxin family protein [Thermoguttaceae bacterium]
MSISFMTFFAHSIFAEELTVAEKDKLRIKDIVKKRNIDDGHIPTPVSGVALLPDGSPAIGFKVDGWGRSGYHSNYGDGFFGAITDEKGHFTLDLWRPYTYNLKITDPNNVYASRDFHLTLDEKDAAPAPIQFQLQKGVVIEGIVINKDTGKPIADLSVYLTHNPVFVSIQDYGGIEKFYEHEKTEQIPREVKTDEKGHFLFSALPFEEQYLVSLNSFHGSFRQADPEELKVYARILKVENEPIELSFEIPSPWYGQVLRGDGTPAAFYPVAMNAVDYGEFCDTDAEGRFWTFKPLQMKSITVDTFYAGECFHRSYDKEILPQNELIHLTPPVLAKGVLVRKSTGLPLRNFKFVCRPRSYHDNFITTNEKGEFEIPELFSGSEARLCFMNEPDGFNSCSIYEVFKKFTPDSTNFDLGTIELEESGWLEPNFLDNLPGKPIKIEGISLDGTKLDWQKYSGKVVLLDFWASWCGPCIQELPNLKAQYEKYHDKGFEVIGISVDENMEALTQSVEKHNLPWLILADAKLKDSVKMINRFAISGVPCCILVGRDGKVISVEARGERLEEELKKLFEPH